MIDLSSTNLKVLNCNTKLDHQSCNCFPKIHRLLMHKVLDESPRVIEIRLDGQEVLELNLSNAIHRIEIDWLILSASSLVRVSRLMAHIDRLDEADNLRP